MIRKTIWGIETGIITICMVRERVMEVGLSIVMGISIEKLNRKGRGMTILTLLRQIQPIIFIMNMTLEGDIGVRRIMKIL